jgi:hypothetical protein
MENKFIVHFDGGCPYPTGTKVNFGGDGEYIVGKVYRNNWFKKLLSYIGVKVKVDCAEFRKA